MTYKMRIFNIYIYIIFIIDFYLTLHVSMNLYT